MKPNYLLKFRICIFTIILISCENEIYIIDEKDPFLGSYECIVYHSYPLDSIDSNGTRLSKTITFLDTIIVSPEALLANDYRITSVMDTFEPIGWSVIYNKIDSTFYNPPPVRTHGKFFQDSIYLHHGISPIMFPSWKYYGNKIK